MTNNHLLAVSLVSGIIGLVTGLLIAGWSSTDPATALNPVDATVDGGPAGRFSGPASHAVASARECFTSPATASNLTPDDTANDLLADEAQHETTDESELLAPLRALLAELQAVDPEAAENQPPAEAIDRSRVEDELRRLMQVSPMYLAYTIDQVRAMQPGVRRDLLLSLIVQSNSPQTDEFARELMASGEPDKIVTGLELVRDSGRSSPAIRADLMHQLQNSAEAPVIKTAIEALTPAVIEPAEQAAILETLAVYRVHADSTIRAAAIEKSVDLSARDIGAEMLLQGLSDASAVVRSTAAFSASSSGIQSDMLRNQLFQVLEDTGEDWSVRHQAFNALSGYRNLLADEYERLIRFESELIAVGENRNG